MHNDNGNRIQRDRRKDDREHQCGESARQADNQKGQRQKEQTGDEGAGYRNDGGGRCFHALFSPKAPARETETPLPVFQ